MKFHERFREALKGENQLQELRKVVIQMRSEGNEKETILSELESFRELVSSSDENIVLDVMDFLVGWSSSHMKID